MGKVTLKDIANEVGVSPATVSYVLNNNESQKISEEVKRKIVQVSQLLGYTKNYHANALATGRSNHVGIYFNYTNFSIENSDKLEYLMELSKFLKENNIDTILLPQTYDKTVDYVDAILCIGLADDTYRTVCNSNYIPTIAIDTYAKDPWNFEIATIYSEVKNTISLKHYFVCYKPASNELEVAIKKENENILFVSCYEDLKKLKQLEENVFLVTPEAGLYHFLKSSFPNLMKYRVDLTKKMNTILKCINLALAHEDVSEHKFFVE